MAEKVKITPEVVRAAVKKSRGSLKGSGWAQNTFEASGGEKCPLGAAATFAGAPTGLTQGQLLGASLVVGGSAQIKAASALARASAANAVRNKAKRAAAKAARQAIP
jgi:hypothetical protein